MDMQRRIALVKKRSCAENSGAENMKKQTVKKRIFISNACMLLVTFGLVLLINLCVVKLYWEATEQKWQESIETMADSMSIGDMLEDWTVHQQSFHILFLADMLICAAVLIFVSLFFTGRLARKIMDPLDALQQGVERIRENELTTAIQYQGDQEFEEICHTFNDMQAHILEEQEKNRKYEKARTDMIAGISHDLRTPLTAIRGSIKGILDGVVKDDVQKEKFLKTAYKRTGEMDVLLNQLFYVAKLETGNMPLHLQKIQLYAWLSEYLKGRKQNISEEIILEADLEKVSGTAMIDPEQMQRILDNLWENSMKYSQVRPVNIHVTLQENSTGFQIVFHDNGQGVPEEKLPFLFDEFYRGDESRNTKDGNGLGLYIVKSLIESMHGKVRAENRDGLAIYIHLPKGE